MRHKERKKGTQEKTGKREIRSLEKVLFMKAAPQKTGKKQKGRGTPRLKGNEVSCRKITNESNLARVNGGGIHLMKYSKINQKKAPQSARKGSLIAG